MIKNTNINPYYAKEIAEKCGLLSLRVALCSKIYFNNNIYSSDRNWIQQRIKVKTKAYFNKAIQNLIDHGFAYLASDNKTIKLYSWRNKKRSQNRIKVHCLTSNQKLRYWLFAYTDIASLHYISRNNKIRAHSKLVDHSTRGNHPSTLQRQHKIRYSDFTDISYTFYLLIRKKAKKVSHKFFYQALKYAESNNIIKIARSKFSYLSKDKNPNQIRFISTQERKQQLSNILNKRTTPTNTINPIQELSDKITQQLFRSVSLG